MAKKIKIEKNQVGKNSKNRKSWKKRARGNCDNLLLNAWEKFKGKALYFNLFLKI